MALNGVNPYDVARNGPAAGGAVSAAFQRPAQSAADTPVATPAAALLPLERPAAPAPPVSQSPPAVRLYTNVSIDGRSSCFVASFVS
jgi:hypothetical protein